MTAAMTSWAIGRRMPKKHPSVVLIEAISVGFADGPFQGLSAFPFGNHANRLPLGAMERQWTEQISIF
ncbi:MAG: hypothetical protein R3E12_08265 [Candidatus Eisenbacteria bacterium]